MATPPVDRSSERKKTSRDDFMYPGAIRGRKIVRQGASADLLRSTSLPERKKDEKVRDINDIVGKNLDPFPDGVK